MSIIKSSSPEFIALGARDLSGRTVPVESLQLPYHLPLFYIYSEKGPTKRVVCNGVNFETIFGKKTLDSDKKYFNHQTLFLKGALPINSAVMIQRVVGKNAGIKSNAVLYIDVLETNVVNYLRTSKGALIPNDNSNDYEIDMNNPVIRGHRIKWIVEYYTANEEPMGTFQEKEGTMEDAEGNKSKMIPILEFRASELGEAYNNLGFSIGSYLGDELDANMKDKTKSLPYKLTLYTRDDKGSSPKIIPTLYGDNYSLVSLKDKVIDPLTKAKINIEYVFDTQWFNTSDETLPFRLSEFEGMYFYRDNFDAITKQFMSFEKDYISSLESTWADGKNAATMSWFDFTTDDKKELLTENYLINPFIGMSSKKVKYFTLQHDDGVSTTDEYQSEVSMSFETPIFLNGGRDGDLTVENYEKFIIADLEKYTDRNSNYQDLAVNVESNIWDSGFGLDVKLALADFIALRKDTFPALSTHYWDLGKKYLNKSQSRALASTLKTRLQLYPESTTFGTRTCRGIIVGGTYKLRTLDTDDRVPLTYELMIKTCKMMGAGPKWDSGYKFDRIYDDGIRGDNKGSLVTYGTDVQPNFIPEDTKHAMWYNGMIWAQPFDLSSFYFPGLRTVYEDETSVLNNFFANMALTAIVKINAKVARKFQGTSFTPNDDVFTKAVETELYKETQTVFDGLYTIKHEVTLTDKDKLRGYSWRQVTTLYGGTMRTVAVHSVDVRRASDLENNE